MQQLSLFDGVVGSHYRANDMPLFAIEIVFSARMVHVTVESQTVAAQGGLPAVRIERVDDQGTHHFAIQKMVPHHHPSVIDPVTAEAERQIEVFWNIFAHLTRCPIRPTGEVQYLHDGQLRRIAAPSSSVAGPMLIQGYTSAWFDSHSEALAQDYDLELLKRFNFARFLDDPVSRFLSLYALLLSTVGERQEEVDRALLAVDPTIEFVAGPGRRYAETTFTRLRNEIAHHREGVSLTETHREIHLQAERFSWLVEEVLATRLTR